MRRLAFPLAVLLLAIAPPAHAGEIVMFRATDESVATETSERAEDLGFDAEQRFSRAIRGFAADLTPEQERELRADPEVAKIVPDRPVRKLAAVAAQPDGVIPPGIRRVLELPQGFVRQAATPTVAVLDTGVDLDHPDLNVVPGKNCVGSGPPDDVDGHGTHVAGTIGARDDGVGVVGVAPGTRIAAVKVLDDTGMGWTSSILCGIEWVLANRAALDIRVANLSLGGSGDSTTCAGDPEHAAYCRLAAAGVTPVVSAGNDGRDFGAAPRGVPAAFGEVLTVAAMTDTDGLPGGAGPPRCGGYADDRYAGFSNYVTSPQDAAHLVAAPGVCIRSTAPGGGTATMSGTSMAAPHVAGLVALCHGEAGVAGPCAGLTTPEIIARMVATAKSGSFATDIANADRLYGGLAQLPALPPPAPPAPEAEADTEPATEPEPAPGPADQVEPAAPPATTTTTASGPAPTAKPAPTIAARLVITGRREIHSFLRRGLRLQVRCGGGCRASIRVRAARARAARNRRPSVIARATAAPDRLAILRPRPSLIAGLRVARRLRVTIEADVVMADGRRTRLRRTLTLSR